VHLQLKICLNLQNSVVPTPIMALPYQKLVVPRHYRHIGHRRPCLRLQARGSDDPPCGGGKNGKNFRQSSTYSCETFFVRTLMCVVSVLLRSERPAIAAPTELYVTMRTDATSVSHRTWSRSSINRWWSISSVCIHTGLHIVITILPTIDCWGPIFETS